MAINQLKQKSRLLARFDTSGTFKAPANVDEVFVSVHSATGGGQGSSGAPGSRYSPSPGTESAGASAGEGRICSAVIQVTPGDSYTVTVGALGTGGGAGSYIPGPGGSNAGTAGNTGGTTSFGGTLLVVTGSGGGGLGSANSAGSGVTSLGTVVPTTSPVTLTGTIATQATGAQTAGVGGGAGGTPTVGSGTNGQGAIVFVYC
jgi:hypothetical protein